MTADESLLSDRTAVSERAASNFPSSMLVRVGDTKETPGPRPREFAIRRWSFFAALSAKAWVALGGKNERGRRGSVRQRRRGIYSSMTELDTQSVQIGLGDVQNGFPRVEALVDERVEVLRDAQLAKNTLKRSHIGYLARVPPR